MNESTWMRLGRTGLAIGMILAGIVVSLGGVQPARSAGRDKPARQVTPPQVDGPFLSTGAGPAVFNGDLSELARTPSETPGTPGLLRYTPGQVPKESIPQILQWIDPVAQNTEDAGLMPGPVVSFAGLNFSNNGSGFPPDTVGDVGPNHYIQAVNTSIGIFDKSSGALLTPALTFNQFFTGPAGTPCDNNNRGDPVVLYDPVVDRWLVSDFAWVNQATGPFYECIAVSRTSDPVSGGWYFYALRADTGNFTGYLNDYPKLGVWVDGWYMTANMFQMPDGSPGFGVRMWALDRSAMINGWALNEIHFDCMDLECASLLPPNLRGTPPLAGSPAYFAAIAAPDQLILWRFHTDWATPGNSILTGPIVLSVAQFAQAPFVLQLGTSIQLDTVSPRLMMQLQYRNMEGVESLWVSHTVLSGGVAGVRWYELRDPRGTPYLAQQSTYQPDSSQRWMGSLAVDQDGNLAIGYSVSSASFFPGIRYAGRLKGELPNRLPQAETTLVNGGGSQLTYTRWGDYSAMSVDPVDDCTFWYTQEYYITTGTNWQTRIGAFKFPSCGVTKATLTGTVRSSLTNQPIPDAPVVAVSPLMTMTVLTDVDGAYSMQLLGGTYTLTAGPLLPGFPTASSVPGVQAIAGQTTAQELFLAPATELVEGAVQVDDTAGNGNGIAEPGESGLLLFEGLRNTGEAPATSVSAHLVSMTAGVSVESADAAYANIAPGQTVTNTTPFQFSVGTGVACGADLNFQKTVTESGGSHTFNFTLNAAQSLPRSSIFSNDVESGENGWTSGGVNSTWGISTDHAHSPTHAWSDSPGGNYASGANAYVRTPAYNLSGKRHVRLSGWYLYSLESGYDYVYLEYSLDGGATWNSQPLLTFTGSQSTWVYRDVDAGALDWGANVVLRYRLVSDAYVTYDGFYVDDILLSYEPYGCNLKFAFLPVGLK